MSGQEMLDILGLRLNDPSEADFNQPIKLEALNKAQLRLAKLLPDKELTELEILKSALSVTTGKVTFATLEAATTADVILNDRIQLVRIGSSGAFATMIDISDVPVVTNNSYLTGLAASPYSWVHSQSIYILPSATTTIDVYYLRQPVDISDSVACELAASLHETVLDLAESMLWPRREKQDRADLAENRALAYVKLLRGEE